MTSLVTTTEMGLGERWGAAGIWWVEARDLTNYLMMHRIAPTAKNYLASNIKSAKFEESGSLFT